MDRRLGRTETTGLLRAGEGMEFKDALMGLTDAGCTVQDVEITGKLYAAGDMDGLIRYLKKSRCNLMEEMHRWQRNVDRMDYLIRLVEKETV